MFSPLRSTQITAAPGGRPLRATADEIDAGRLHIGERDLGEIVAAHRPHHAGHGAGARGGQCLVGALAAGDQLVAGPSTVSPGRGRAFTADDQIDIDRAEDDDHAASL